MPAWLLPLLLKYGVPLVIKLLTKLGVTNWAERVAIKFGISAYQEIQNIHIYSAPSDYPEAQNPTPATSNLKVEQPAGD